MKKSIYLLLISLTFQNVIIAQNKFYIGLNSPFHFGSGRFGSYLDMKNEMQDHTGKDALKFGLSAGFGVFGSLLFEEDVPANINPPSLVFFTLYKMSTPVPPKLFCHSGVPFSSIFQIQ